jgi:hypothetical protein
LSWQSLYLSVAVPIIQGRTEEMFDMDPELYNAGHDGELIWTSSTSTSTQFSTLPRECDNFTRITSVTTYEHVVPDLAPETYFWTFSEGITAPFSPVPTYLPRDKKKPVPRLECAIPADECPEQWALFSEFLRTATPDMKEWNGAYQYYKSKMDKQGSHTAYTLKNDDWYGRAIDVRWQNMSLAGGLLTGSRLLDEILHISHRNGGGLKNFFGGCPQAQKVAANNCQVGLETKFPYQFSDLSDEEAAKHIIKYYGCSLQVAYVRIIRFKNTFPKRERNICTNNGWGETYEQPVPMNGEPDMTAKMTAITFPAHYDHGKSCKTQCSLYQWLNSAI